MAAEWRWRRPRTGLAAQECGATHYPSQTTARLDARLFIVGALFCLSGASALVYQVTWQRILALHSGVGIYSVAIIVAAFLAGLGIGSFVGGVLSVRTGPPAALRAFAVLELGVAGFGLASSALYYDLLQVHAPALFTDVWSAAAVHFVLLIVPTTLMGMSLPFLVRATVLDPATASATVGYLYGINVLGAAAGALLAPWVLIRLLGIEGAVTVAALGNVVAGVGVLALARLPARVSVSQALDPPRGAELPGSRPFALWVALYTLSGFAALSLEILWFRVVDVAVKSTAFTFGTVLSVYLLGFGLGSLLGGRLAVQTKRPLAAFLLCQSVLLAYAGASLRLLVTLPPRWPGYAALMAHWQQYQEFALGEVWDLRMIALLYVALPVFLYGPPTVLMGMSFGFLQRAVHDERASTGRKVGVLQAGNIVGNVAGSLLTGLVLLDFAGTAWAMRALLGIGIVFPLLGLYYYRWRPIFVLTLLALIGVAYLVPGRHAIWLRLHGLEGPSAIFAEDATAVAAIAQDGDMLRVSVNGKGNSWLPFGGLHSQLGGVPAAMHPSPERVAIIGLGSGDTAWAAAFRPQTRQITVFELSAGQRGLLTRAVAAAPLPQLGNFLGDPRVELVVADGRRALSASGEQYDVIEADGLRPNSAYSGNLYSEEFFALSARRLGNGGLMCTWVPTLRVYVSFCRAFPHVVELLDGQIAVGSNEPIPLDAEAWAARLDPQADAYLGRRIADQVRAALRTARPAVPARCRALEPNRDLFPRDEFQTPPGR